MSPIFAANSLIRSRPPSEERSPPLKFILSFIRENLVSGLALTETNCPKEAQEQLFHAALKGQTLEKAILSALNTNIFLPIDIMGKWLSLSTGQKQLVFLWYAFHPDDSYLCYCVQLSSGPEDLEKKILTSIFPVRIAHKEWVEESQALIRAVPIIRDDEYYSALDTISSRDERLDYLTATTARERVYILHLVGQWLRDDQESVLQSQKLKEHYPQLSAYLNNVYPDEYLNLYFGRYKSYKLLDIFL